jgi:hypothetical protein
LQERVEIGDRGEAAEPTSKTSATTTAEHVEGIKNGAVPDKVENRIKLLGFANMLGQVGSFYLDALCAQLFKGCKIVAATSGGDDA